MENKFIQPLSSGAFVRFQQQGFPHPHFASEARLRRVLTGMYARLIRTLLTDFMRHAKETERMLFAFTGDAASDEGQLPQFFERMAENERKAKDAQQKAELKAF